MTIFPIFTSSITLYLLYHKDIIQPLVAVTSKQQYVLQPLQNLQLSLWDISKTITSFAVNGDDFYFTEYKREADNINESFKKLLTAVSGHDLAVRDVNKARNDWNKVAEISVITLSTSNFHGDVAAQKRNKEFETSINNLSRSLVAIYEDIRIESEQKHGQSLADILFSEHLTIVAFISSTIFAALGILLINRSLVSSMNKLASGAMRFAAGDREHQIEIQIPHELVSVANAFNLMTAKILKQEEALVFAAIIDELTGLFNRREFDRLLFEEIKRSKRYGSPVSLIMGDIDHFKIFNDTYGHQAGDEVLRTVAQTIKAGLREIDKAFRFGGEEFIILLPECDKKNVYQAAERIRKAVEEIRTRLNDGKIIKTTISLGVATYPDDGATPDTLLKSGDIAMYESKEKGRNRTTIAG
ncbi:MAG: diguanylate cyclase [Desulforhopalus sp.]